MALSLANMLARVKRNVPTTTMDTELQDALLERMNYLVSLDVFPFQEKYQTDTLASGAYNIATPDNFATAKSVVIWMGDNKEKDVEIMDSTTFSKMFPKPNERTADIPSYCCIRVAEGEIWFDCPASEALTLRIEFFAIPDDATDTTISQLTELAKLTLIKWGSADGFRMIAEFDRADQWEKEGDKFFMAMEKRYKLSKEFGARFISPKEFHALRRN